MKEGEEDRSGGDRITLGTTCRREREGEREREREREILWSSSFSDTILSSIFHPFTILYICKYVPTNLTHAHKRHLGSTRFE